MMILVDAPTGAQELIKIGEGGSYFDNSRVLWDEREHGELPEITLGGMVRDGDSLIFNEDRMNEHFAAIAPRVPSSVTMRQAHRALHNAGILNLVDAAIDSIEDEDEKAAAFIDWNKSNEVHRNWPSIVSIGSALGLTSEQIDTLFIQASGL